MHHRGSHSGTPREGGHGAPPFSHLSFFFSGFCLFFSAISGFCRDPFLVQTTLLMCERNPISTCIDVETMFSFRPPMVTLPEMLQRHKSATEPLKGSTLASALSRVTGLPTTSFSWQSWFLHLPPPHHSAPLLIPTLPDVALYFQGLLQPKLFQPHTGSLLVLVHG